MRLYKVRVRRWYPEPTGEQLVGRGTRTDTEVLLEADTLGHAREAGFEWALGHTFLGANPGNCEVMEVAGATLPYAL